MKRFCEVCNKETPFITKLAEETRTVGKLTFSYCRIAAYCNVCNIEVYDPDLHNAGVESCQTAYFAALDKQNEGT